MSRPSNQDKRKDLEARFLQPFPLNPRLPTNPTAHVENYQFIHIRPISEDTNYKLSASDEIIIVMGPTGAGKSTFIEYATRQNGASIGHGLQSQTSEVLAVRTKHPKDQGSVVLVDTPGFDDTNRSDIEIFTQIAGWFGKTYKEKVPISTIVYLHRISDNRMARSPLKNLQMFARMCGQETMPRVILGTTMWSETRPATGERREKELKGTFWADMIAQGCTMQRFEGSYESAWQLMSPPADSALSAIDKSIPKGPKDQLPAKDRSIPEGPKLSVKDRIIIVIGPTGAGKSTFIEYATQQNGGTVGHSLKSETSEIRAVRAKHPADQGSVIFVDTPGFNDTNRSDIEIFTQIAGWFGKAYKEKVPLAAIVYLHRISDNRMVGAPFKNLQMFASMCGQEAMPRVVLGTTMWSETMPATGARREKELKTTFWADMIKQGCNAQRFGDSYESAWQVIGKLPTEEENVVLSREIYDDKKKLNATATGVKLTEELNRLIADQKSAAHRLEEQVNGQHNPVLVAELQQRKVDIELKIGGVTAQLQQLKVPFGRKIMNFITGKRARKSGV